MSDSDPQPSIELQSSSRRIWRRLVWGSVVTFTLVVGVVGYRYWRREMVIQRIEGAGGIVSLDSARHNSFTLSIRDRGIHVFDNVYAVLNINDQSFAQLCYLTNEPIIKLEFVNVQFSGEKFSFLSHMNDLSLVEICPDVKLTEQAVVELGKSQSLKKLTFSNASWRAAQLVTPSPVPLAQVWSRIFEGEPRFVQETPQSYSSNFSSGIAESLKHLNHLEVLEIQKRILSENDLHSISQLKALRELKLIDCRLPEEGMKSLAELSKLRYLGLNGSPVTSGQLLELQNLPKLEQLHLPGTELSKEEMEQVKAAFQHCKVTGTYGSDSTEEKSESLPLKLIIRQ